jgi:alanyl-tRNA synthetase
MTERLYYQDPYLQEFEAIVVESGERVCLDRTAFYPTSGGQPFDLGTLGGATVREVIDEEDRVVHLLDRPIAEGRVEGRIDWGRRFDHMQQHTGQHLLSAVLEDLYKIPTLSFHMGAELSDIEIGTASLSEKQIERLEARCAEIVMKAVPVTISFEEASKDLELRKASAREGTLRIISIEGVDRSACGGTHVRSTAEIGPVFLRKLDKVRGNVRLEFVCGGRARKHARVDFERLGEIGRALSLAPENTVAAVSSLTEKLKIAEKTISRLTKGLAILEGTELYSATKPDSNGLRVATQHGAIDDAMRARAQAFVAGPKAVFLAVSEEPASVLLAASGDSGVDAGKRVKDAVTSAGGRGGGNATMAQGSIPDKGALTALVKAILLR